jgi:hypothetical protein
MKGLVDGYVDKYTAEEASFTEASEAMKLVIANSADAEAKERAIDEKLKMKSEHEKTLKDLAGFVRTLDETVKSLRPGEDKDWKEQFPDLKAQITKIYTANPALLQQRKISRHTLRTVAARETAIPSGSQSDAVLGTMKGLVDGYVEKYTAEEASFAEASDAMKSVIDNAADDEAKARAVDEKANMKTEHEKTLRDLAGFLRTMDETVKALRPGADDDWKDQFPDLKGQISKIYAAYPALIQAPGKSSHAFMQGEPKKDDGASKNQDLMKKMPLKAQEQGYTGKKVKHADGKTGTDDWRDEYGHAESAAPSSPKKSGSIQAKSPFAAAVLMIMSLLILQ